MITKYRNRAIIYFVISLILTVIVVVLLHKALQTPLAQRSGASSLLFVIAYIGGWLSWVLVGFSLAKAKGYSKDFTGPLFVIVYLFGICLPIIVIGFPLVILIGLEDRAKHRSRRSSSQ